MATQKILVPLADDGLPHYGYVRLPQILCVLPYSRATFLRLVADGKFPRPVKLSERCSAWRVSDVRALIASLEPGPIDGNVAKATAAAAAKRASLIGEV